MGQVEEKYKQTEIGLIPSDWNVKQLKDVFSITAAGDLRKDYYSITQDENYCYPIYSNALTNKGLYGYSSVYTNDENTITVTARGEVGNANPRFAKYTAIGRVIILKPIVELNCYYVSECINKLVDFANESTGVPQLTSPQVAKYQVPMPTKKEQDAITTVLSDANGYIDSLEKLIAKKRDIKQGAMQELLKPKEGWVVKKLGEICNYQNGTALEKYFNNSDGFKVISIGNYSPGGKFVATSSFIDRNLENIIGKFILKKNDLTMILNDKTSVGSIIGRVLLIEEDNQYVFNQRTMRLVPKKDMYPTFLYHLINSDGVHNKIVASSKPGTQIYVNTNDIIEMEISIPKTLEEQQAISKIFSDMDAEIATLEKQLEKTRQIKQGMMQQLLTGKIRLI